MQSLNLLWKQKNVHMMGSTFIKTWVVLQKRRLNYKCQILQEYSLPLFDFISTCDMNCSLFLQFLLNVICKVIIIFKSFMGQRARTSSSFRNSTYRHWKVYTFLPLIWKRWIIRYLELRYRHSYRILKLCINLSWRRHRVVITS